MVSLHGNIDSYDMMTGYAAASYPLKGLGGSTQLQCLPYRPTWNSNTASTPLGRTILTAAEFSLGKLYGKIWIILSLYHGKSRLQPQVGSSLLHLIMVD